MRIRHQLFAALGVALAVAATVAAGVAGLGERMHRIQQAERDANQVARDVAGLLALTHEYTLHFNARPIRQWRARHAMLAATLARARADEVPPSQALEELAVQVERLPPLFDELVTTAVDDADDLTLRRRSLLVERLLAESQEMVDARHHWSDEVARERARVQRLLDAIVVAGPGVLVAVIFALGWIVVRRMLDPLERLQSAVNEIRPGGVLPSAASAHCSELGDTARAVDAMTRALSDAHAALEAEVASRRATQARLQLVVDNVPALISHLDPDRRYTLVNRAYLDWTPHSEHEIVGRTIAQIHGAAGAAALDPHFEVALRGHTTSFEAELARGGKPRALLVTYVPDVDSRGRVVGVYSMKSDITALHRAQQHLRLITESAPLGIFVCTDETRIAYANPAWCAMTGVGPQDARTSTIDDVVDAGDVARVREAFRRALDGEGSQVCEFGLARARGGKVRVRGHLAQLTRDRVVEGVVGMLEDVTERHALQAALEKKAASLARSNDDLERFAYTVSHDLQEPLRMVTSYGQLLERRHRDALGTEAHEFLGYMVDGGRRAQAMVSGLLGIARVDSDGRTPCAVDLAAVLAESLRGLRVTIDTAGARVTHDALPTVTGDPLQLAQLLTNLIGNAVKFRGSQAPRVHLSATLEGTHWRIGVSDNGIGIEPRNQERVFEVFQRLHLRSEHPGTGIGLAICKRIVERHGGRLWVESAPGTGSTFHFTLAGAAVDAPVRAGPLARSPA